MKKIILTGGGTAGHATPNLALVPFLKDAGYEILYIGSMDGIEKEIIESAGIPYKGVHTGKLRRYFTLKNFTDPFKVLKGASEAKKIIAEFKPDIVFSKGGFVSVPVVSAAKRLRVPSITHESDYTLGLANKINLRSVRKICVSFPETAEKLPENKVVVTGCPIRKELLSGSKAEGLKITGLGESRPILLVIGGSLGATAVNSAIRKVLDDLLEKYQIIHICGKGNVDKAYETEGYVQYEYVSEELKDLYAAADIIVSRAGANTICEIATLKKPSLLIPLPSSSSRGDQLLNAESFKKQGFADVLIQERMTGKEFVAKINELYENREKYIANLSANESGDASKKIFDLIEQYALKRI